MSQFAIGSLALELTGGGAAGRLGSQIGQVAGVTSAITTTILNVVLSAIRRIVDFIKARIRALFALREQLKQFDPTVAQAAAEARIGSLIRNIERARELGPGILKLTRGMQSLKDAIVPLATMLQNRMLGLLNKLLFGPTSLFLNAKEQETSVAKAIESGSDFLTRLIPMFLDDLAKGDKLGLTERFGQSVDRVIEEIRNLNKVLTDNSDLERGEGSNAILLNDLRLLTEGASLRTFTTDVKGRKIPDRTRIGTKGRDLFGGVF